MILQSGHQWPSQESGLGCTCGARIARLKRRIPLKSNSGAVSLLLYLLRLMARSSRSLSTLDQAPIVHTLMYHVNKPALIRISMFVVASMIRQLLLRDCG